VHTNPAKKINYYRILQQDRDNRSSYSKTVSVFFTTYAKPLGIFPNVVTDGKINVQTQEAAVIYIYNSTGQLALSKELPAGTQTVNVRNLSKGIYFLKAGAETEKFIIQ
jgi:hypothetical protein